MFGLGKSLSSSSTKPTYFDIRLKTTYKNLIIVRGSHYESPSVVLSGDLVFSIPEPLSVKRITLKLVGRYKLDFLEVLERSKNFVSNPVKQESVIFECSWDNLLTSAEGVIKVGTNDLQSNPSQRFADTQVPISLLRPDAPVRKKLIRTHSSGMSLQLPENGFSGTPFQNVTASNGTSFHLPDGNYEFPFECILPGDIPETVEGLLAGSILYKFEANIERSGFNKSSISKHQYFRILRTLSSDNLSLNETISIGNSRPDKVQYEVSIPSKAIPIGGSTPINILLVPLIKGMKVGLIKAQIVQYYVFKGQHGEVYNDESLTFDSTMTQMDNHELNDKISIDSFINIPSNLKKVTQDCDFKQDFIKVRHKLKLQINLVMPNGNISELRTNLPINLFISPNVEMSGRTILLDKHGKIHFRKEEEKLFERNNLYHRGNSNAEPTENPSQHVATDRNDPFQMIPNRSVNAPPNYHEHVHDQILFTENTSNTQSSFATPANVGTFVFNNSGTNVQASSSDEYLSSIIPNLNSTCFNSPAESSPSTPNFNPLDPNNLELLEIQKRLDNLDFEKLSETPSYHDALGNNFSTIGHEFAPEYMKKTTNRQTSLSRHANEDETYSDSHDGGTNDTASDKDNHSHRSNQSIDSTNDEHLPNVI